MKNCKRRTIFSWIFAFVLLIPMFSIAIRCLYVVINKNAYQSYSDSYIQSSTKVTNTTLLLQNQDYVITYKDVGTAQMYNDVIYYYSNINIDWTEYGATSGNTYVAFMLNSYQNPNNRILVYYYDANSTLQSVALSIWGSQLTTIYFTLSDYTVINDNFSNTIQDYTLYFLSYKQDRLDNVFEYSIQQFVDKHGNGVINFFGLLEQYFMQSTTANALYFTFANWCLNYVLLVSCVWLLFSVLMWFINYCNYMLNTSFRKGHGD